MRNRTRSPQLRRNLLSSAVLLALSGHATAAQIDIEADCTLIDAIQAANQDAPQGGCPAGDGADVIQVINPNSTLTLTEAFGPSSIPIEAGSYVGLPPITSDITIEGNGLTIQADAPLRVFEVPGSSDSSPQIAFTLRDATISGAFADPDLFSGDLHTHSAVYARFARVYLDNVHITKNFEAVGIIFSDMTRIENSVFRDNTAIINKAAALTLTASTVSIENSSFVHNRQDLPTIYDPTGFSDVPTIAVRFTSTVSISNSTISGNFGGSGVSVQYTATTRSLDNSPVTTRGNELQTLVTIDNSTITGNTGISGGGLRNYGDVEYGNINVSGSIIADNVAFDNPDGRNIAGNPRSLTVLDGTNIVGQNGDAGVGNAALGSGDKVLEGPVRDLLHPLTETNGQFLHPLASESIAIDALSKGCGDLTHDQEGSPRPIDGNGDGNALCDIGAFEKSPDILVSADCDLTDAILSANNDSSIGGCAAGVGADTVRLPGQSTHTLSADVFSKGALTFGLPIITSAVTIDGQDSVIERASNAPEFGMAYVTPGADLLLRDVELTNGSYQYAGVASFGGNIGLQGATLSGMNGRALSSSGGAKLLIEDSRIINNTTLPGSPGNGAYGVDTVKITGSEFSGNSGAFGSALHLNDNRYVSIENSTISGNTASFGGAFVLNGPAQINGITVSNNTVTDGGGGAYFTTRPYIAPNRSGIVLRNSIMSGNSAIPAGSKGVASANEVVVYALDGSAGVVSFNNIFGSDDDSGTLNLTIDGDSIVPSVSTSEIISPLRNNGGKTLSHAPVSGSIAIDAVQSNCRLFADQIGRSRPADGDASGPVRCDIGAVEFSRAPILEDARFDLAFDAANGSLVGTLFVADDNGDIPATGAWAITAGNDLGTFEIDDNGQILINDNFALTGSTLTVEVTDSAALTDTATVAINILPEIDVVGNGVSIADGDDTPDVADGTDFGITTIGTPVTRIFTVTNLGESSLDIGTVSSSGAGFSVTAQPQNTALGAGETAQFTVEFNPLAEGSFVGSVSFASNDADESSYEFVVAGISIADNAPPVVEDRAFFVPELSTSGTIVGTLVATDPDDNIPAIGAWSIIDGNTAGAYAIDDNGAITVVDAVALADAILTVQVMDDAGLSDTAAVTISVLENALFKDGFE